MRKSSDDYSPASGVAAVSSQCRGEQGIFPLARHEGVYGNSHPLYQSKAQGESRFLCGKQLIQGELQGPGLLDRTGRRGFRLSERKSGPPLDKRIFGTADHDEDCSGMCFGKVPQRRRLAIGSADSIEPAVSRTTRIVAAEANMRTTQSAWAIAYSGLVTTVMQQAWRESDFVAVRLSTVTV